MTGGDGSLVVGESTKTTAAATVGQLNTGLAAAMKTPSGTTAGLVTIGVDGTTGRATVSALGTSAAANAVAMRDGAGSVQVPTATGANQAVPKTQLDAAIAEIPAGLASSDGSVTDIIATDAIPSAIPDGQICLVWG
jgi:hypothetical protein